MSKLKTIAIRKKQSAVGVLGFLLYILIAGYIYNLVSLEIPYILLNALCLSIPYLAILSLSGRTSIALGISSCLAFIINYVDVCVFAARLTHIRVSDFSAADQAMRVASNYRFVWTAVQWKQIFLIVALVVLFVAISKLEHLKPYPCQTRIAGASILLLLILILVEGTLFHLLPIPYRFSGFDANKNVNEAGLVGYWYSQVVKRKAEKPEGYSSEKANAAIETYADDLFAEDFEPVNIVVIMNESLTDYTLVGDIKFEDPLPYIHSMVESGQMFEGKLAASVLGGGTCNTEYEFLTGHSLMFLPDGVYAFMTYVTGESESIAREIKPLGYKTSFFHPYYSQEWNREAVYSFFGFDSFAAGDTLEGGFKNKDSVGNITQSLFKKRKEETYIFGEGLEYARSLISDSQAYKLLLDMLSLYDSVSNDFMFCVTIQNHGGYEYEGDNFVSTEYVKGDENSQYTLEEYSGNYSSRPEEVNQYLTLSNMSDSAFRELVETLSEVDEKTIVVMFGDHQPGISVCDYIEYDENVHLSVDEETHVVPYLVWANYDMDFDFPEYISANFLSSVIKMNIGMPLNAWDKFRLDVMEEYPVMTSGFVLDKDYNVVSDTNTDLLRDYSYIQYMKMFE